MSTTPAPTFHDGNNLDLQPEPLGQQHHHFVQIETPKTGHDASKFHAQAPKFTLEWKHLSLKVKVKNEQTKETEEKVILNDV
ncbi:Atp-binding protein, partial [Globisporangium polare]